MGNFYWLWSLPLVGLGLLCYPICHSWAQLRTGNGFPDAGGFLESGTLEAGMKTFRGKEKNDGRSHF